MTVSGIVELTRSLTALPMVTGVNHGIVMDYEASIDRIVYGLFGLDAEEIALLEAAGRVGPA